MMLRHPKVIAGFFLVAVPAINPIFLVPLGIYPVTQNAMYLVAFFPVVCALVGLVLVASGVMDVHCAETAALRSQNEIAMKRGYARGKADATPAPAPNPQPSPQESHGWTVDEEEPEPEPVPVEHKVEHKVHYIDLNGQGKTDALAEYADEWSLIIAGDAEDDDVFLTDGESLESVVFVEEMPEPSPQVLEEEPADQTDSGPGLVTAWEFD